MLRMRLVSIALALSAVTEIGTSWMFCSRRCAVTKISSSLEAWSAVCACNTGGTDTSTGAANST